MHVQPEFTARDRSRSHYAKRCSMTRRAQRRDKSTRLFLALAFPADLGAFTPIASAGAPIAV